MQFSTSDYISLAAVVIAACSLVLSFYVIASGRRKEKTRMHDQERYEVNNKLAQTARTLLPSVRNLQGGLDSERVIREMCVSLNDFRFSTFLSKSMQEMVERLFWEIAATREDGPGAQRDISDALSEIHELALKELKKDYKSPPRLRAMGETARRLRENDPV